MMKFANIGMKYSNCTVRCRPSSTNGTVVLKSSWSTNQDQTKTFSKSSPSIQGQVTAPWGGSLASSETRQLLAVGHPHRVGARFASTKASSENLYETLGVSPKATHKEIKAAYYNLSLTYHPDKNNNCEVAARKFREITTAYEVLGNFQNRRKYDRGHHSLDVGGVKQDAAEGYGVYESHRGKHYRSQVSVHTGRNNIYNFDEWTKLHYGETFARKRMQRAQYEAFQQKERNTDGEKHVELMMATILFMVMGFMYFVTIESYDTPRPIVRSNDAQPRPLAEMDRSRAED